MQTSSPARKKQTGFTLIEVMIGATVMVLVIGSSMATLAFGYRLLENARLTTLAGQVLQSEMETLRLMHWSDISALDASAEFDPEIALDSASYGKFICKRMIAPVPDRIDVKRITLTATWSSMGGTSHTRRYVSYFAKDGLNDYYYRTFN